jgi:hypothetical protein
MMLQEMKGIMDGNLEVKKVLNSGYYLGSIFVMMEKDEHIREWRLIFYNPSTSKVLDSKVTRDSGNFKVEVGYPVDGTKKLRKLVWNDDIDLSKAVEIAKKDLSRIGADNLILNYLVSFHSKKVDNKKDIFGNVWSVNVVFKGLTVTMYDIDASSGNIIRTESMSLVG